MPDAIGGSGASTGTISYPPAIDDPAITKIAEYVRFFMRDYPELNRITDGYDHSTRHIKWAILDTLSDWSSTPPFLGQDLNLIISRNWISVFVRGVAINLLESIGILHLRNHLAYSDGGVNVQTENPQMIQAWLTMFKSTYEQKKQRILVALNIENMLGPGIGGVHSEYLWVNTFYGSL